MFDPAGFNFRGEEIASSRANETWTFPLPTEGEDVSPVRDNVPAREKGEGDAA
jgi:hypothetical protein